MTDTQDPIHVIASTLAAVQASVQVDILSGCQIYDAALLAQQHYPQIEPTNPLLLCGFSDNVLTSKLQRTLQAAYPTSHRVTLVQSAAGGTHTTIEIALATLNQHADVNPQTSLYIPPVDEGGSFHALQEIVAHLRAPDGCPWDRKQTLLTLREGLINECFEVIEALDIEEGGTDNRENIIEELGDVLLLPAMMIQIASEEGRFQMADVARGIVTKLIRRHPHVYANASVDGVDQVVSNWDAIKTQEKAERGEKPRGPLDGVPPALPALEKALKLQSKAKKAGLLDRAALANSVETLLDTFNREATAQNLGALLWSLTALAKRYDLNAEDALRSYAVNFRNEAEAGVGSKE